MNSKETRLAVQKLPKDELPYLLTEIADPPKVLYFVGNTELLKTHTLIAIVGSRKYSHYGERTVEKIIKNLQGYQIAIVSGLAYGMDALAHRAALKYKIPTISIPGSGLDPKVIYPRGHAGLATEILSADGLLLSEYEPVQPAARWTFPKRNRLIAGIAQAAIIIEAGKKSGSLITARLAMEYNRSVLAVPGPIDSPTSAGTNYLITQGARSLLSTADILDEIGIKANQPPIQKKLFLSAEENTIYTLLDQPESRNEILRKSGLSTQQAQIILSKMEIQGLIGEKMGKIYRM